MFGLVPVLAVIVTTTGTAALVAACGAPWGLASDVGGSIRIPAYYCGLFGHKPTGGTVPNTNTWPPCHNEVGWDWNALLKLDSSPRYEGSVSLDRYAVMQRT